MPLSHYVIVWYIIRLDEMQRDSESINFLVEEVQSGAGERPGNEGADLNGARFPRIN